LAIATNPWAWRHFESCPSTQDIAIEAAQRGAALPLAILARQQTAGRGRGGRTWHALDGNLNLSLALEPAAISPSIWPLLAGVAVHRAVAPLLPDPAALRLKWPNDLLLGGAKLAGILIESASSSNPALDWLVIGIGLNIAGAPSLPDRPATSLAAHGVVIAPENLAHAITAAIDELLAVSNDAIRQEWLSRATPRGTDMTVHGPAGMVHGRFAGLAPDGALLLDTGETIRSGDVLLR
jgi:BirA family biotin operon repressor/biotin-[acetyl-CoA-carboxylase] ligase